MGFSNVATKLAKHPRKSLEDLIREAGETGPCRVLPVQARLAAVRRLASLSLPVGDPAEMERESVPSPDDLLP